MERSGTRRQMFLISVVQERSVNLTKSELKEERKGNASSK
jgi:hypothetical protein